MFIWTYYIYLLCHLNSQILTIVFLNEWCNICGRGQRMGIWDARAWSVWVSLNGNQKKDCWFVASGLRIYQGPSDLVQSKSPHFRASLLGLLAYGHSGKRPKKAAVQAPAPCSETTSQVPFGFCPAASTRCGNIALRASPLTGSIARCGRWVEDHQGIIGKRTEHSFHVDSWYSSDLRILTQAMSCTALPALPGDGAQQYRCGDRVASPHWIQEVPLAEPSLHLLGWAPKPFMVPECGTHEQQQRQRRQENNVIAISHHYGDS